jgi:GTP-binding nuclear protein Ran
MEYKIILIGFTKVGKTSFIKKLLNIRYFADQIYVPTLGVDIYPLIINTNHGLIKFNIWDCAGDPRFRSKCWYYYGG